jgi:hypothetical protein
MTALATSNLATTRSGGRRGIPRLLPVLCVVVAAGLVLAGCGRKDSEGTTPTPEAASAAQAPASPAANPVDPAAPPDLQEKMRLQQAVAMRDGKAPAAPTMTLRGGEPATPEVLAAYNQQLAQLIFRQRDAPETLDELVRRWPMPRLPTPPAGKQVVYDARNRIIKLYPP